MKNYLNMVGTICLFIAAIYVVFGLLFSAWFWKALLFTILAISCFLLGEKISWENFKKKGNY